MVMRTWVREERGWEAPQKVQPPNPVHNRGRPGLRLAEPGPALTTTRHLTRSILRTSRTPVSVVRT